VPENWQACYMRYVEVYSQFLGKNFKVARSGVSWTPVSRVEFNIPCFVRSEHEFKESQPNV